MRKLVMVMTIVTLALTIGVKTSIAQSSIGFGDGTSTGDVTFTANGDGTASLAIGTCTAGTCTLTGSNTGGGTFTFTTTYPGSNQIQVSSGYIISANGTTTTFAYTSPGGNLSGTVTWSSMISDGIASITGTLSITSSTFSGLLGPGGSATISITTNGYGSELSTYIFGTAPAGDTEGATVTSGSVIAPEPSTLLLFGTGFLLVGGVLRRRLAV